MCMYVLFESFQKLCVHMHVNKTKIWKNKCSRSRLKTQCILNLMILRDFLGSCREKSTLSFFSKLEVLEVSVERCRSTDGLMALTIFRPSPVSSAVTRVLFPADQVNWWRPLPPYIKNPSVADEKCAISLSFVSDTIVPQVFSRPRPISTSWWSTKAIPIVVMLIPQIMT